MADPIEVMGGPCDTIFIVTPHDTHAELVVEGLRRGKNVFVEKPLAVTSDELEAVETAFRDSDRPLMVGFNRRWSPAIADIASLVGTAPIQMIYRVNAGAIAPEHWFNDRRMGGRLLGEACHFVDTCNHLSNGRPVSVYAVSSGGGELILDDDFSLLIRYDDGSQAAIVYGASSGPGAGKERLEVIGGGWSIELTDFAVLKSHGPGGTDVRRYRPPDKGHSRELQVFRDLVSGETDSTALAESFFVTSHVTLAALESMATGMVVTLQA